MKTRLGFVSNSSTSSFMIAGIYFRGNQTPPGDTVNLQYYCPDYNEDDDGGVYGLWITSIEDGCIEELDPDTLSIALNTAKKFFEKDTKCNPNDVRIYMVGK